MSEEIRKKLLERLDALKIFPNNKEVRILRKRILQQLERLEKKVSPESKEELKALSNSKKAAKLKRYHRYIRLIRDNFPKLPYNQIRTQLSDRKQGKQVSIPDVIWQNPSS